jgi:hypothetical protein
MSTVLNPFAANWLSLRSTAQRTHISPDPATTSLAPGTALHRDGHGAALRVVLRIPRWFETRSKSFSGIIRKSGSRTLLRWSVMYRLDACTCNYSQLFTLLYSSGPIAGHSLFHSGPSRLAGISGRARRLSEFLDRPADECRGLVGRALNNWYCIPRSSVLDSRFSRSEATILGVTGYTQRRVQSRLSALSRVRFDGSSPSTPAQGDCDWISESRRSTSPGGSLMIAGANILLIGCGFAERERRSRSLCA